MDDRKVLVAMTGASGAGYALELLKGLKEAGMETTLIYNDTARMILSDEQGLDIEGLSDQTVEIVHASRMDHRLASGSNKFHSMVICPCSTSTASKIASGISDNLTTRCAAVALKEGRKLVLVIRETPLSPPVLGSLYDLSRWGVVVMPASPPFYDRKGNGIGELMRSFAGRMMDVIGIENDLSIRYTPGED